MSNALIIYSDLATQKLFDLPYDSNGRLGHIENIKEKLYLGWYKIN